MEVKETPAAALRRPAPTPKALIHEKYGTQACYIVEEVQQSVDSICPGLVIAQKSQILYRCCLVLPELSVTSDTFTKKKDAEQSAAKMAVEKLGIQSASTDLTPQDAWNELVARLSFFFSEKFLSSSHPLVSHFRVALERVQDLHSMIPFSAIVACDAKVNSLCKIIDPRTESDPILVSSFIWKASKTCDSVCTSTGGGFWVGKCGSYSPEALQLLTNCALDSVDPVKVEALHIPCSIEGDIESLSLNISGNQYYMDVIAEKLGARDASHILVSRTVGKASSEMKLYFPIPEVALGSSNSSGDLLSDVEGNASLKSRQNKRASYLSGQNIYDDAILANVGYTRKSSELFFEDVSPCSYYRMILGKVPDGQYKLSREAILTAELPTSFTTRSNWKGPLPRDLLCVFCRQHRLLEPIFSVKTIDSSETLQSEACKKMKMLRLCGDGKITNGCVPAATARELDNSSTFKCEMKILSRKQDIILECSSDKIYRKESDSVQNTSLKVLTWLKKYFMQLDMPVEKLSSFGLDHNIIIYPVNFSREFSMLKSIYGAKKNSNIRKCTFLRSNSDQPDLNQENGMIFVNVDGEDSGVYPSPGSLACINYVVTLTREGDPRKELLERRDDFEFEIGTGAVINQLEACVTQLSVNQTTLFVTTLPSRDLLLAASGEYTRIPTQSSLSNCFLEYSIKVLRVTEALEDRMEQALFSPSLSKQRVQFAVRHINDSHLTSLVDFGCGSGSLLDSLLEHSTTLETIAGVDISRKGLTRAAKIVHSKMSKNSLCQESIKSAVLYDGSITEFDARLYGFDIGTCLEVIEHMEEDQACLFGDVVLSSFCPRVLIVSTPNYEYNPLLQKSAFPNKEEDSEERSSACKFRNYDHKFEWTRKQFEQWATDLAVRHNYSVEFSGVGGSGDVEPGFASQIAVFRSRLHEAEKICLRDEDQSHPYEVIWEWNNRSSSAT